MNRNRVENKIHTNWPEVKLSDIGSFSKGAGISKDQLVSRGYNAVRYGELYTTHNFQIKKIHSFIPDKIISETKKIKYGDILFAGSGETIDEIGKSAAYLLNEDCYAGGDLIIFSPISADSLFLSYFLNIGEARKKLRELGQGQSIVHIYKSDIEKLKFHLPSLSEQNRIVSVFETWDKAIEKLAKKIEFKKNIKKGLMQRLLTGKLRLSGFSDKWRRESLNNLIIRQEKTNRQSGSSMDYGKYPFFNNSSKGFDQYLDVFDFDGEMLIANTGGVAYFDYYFGKFSAMSDCFVFAAKEDCRFLFYKLKIIESLINHEGFTGSGIKHLDKKFFLKIKIDVPSIEEQKAISKVLVTADKEIEAHEQKLKQIKEQKNYLLNNLITGAIRTPETMKIKS